MAIYGAGIATSALGWQVLDRLVSIRPRLKVSLGLGYFAAPPFANALSFEARNVGRIPVHLSECGLGEKKAPLTGGRVPASLSFVPGTRNLPVTLEAGQSFTGFVLPAAFLSAEQSGPLKLDQLRWVYFRDQVGRDYSARIKDGLVDRIRASRSRNADEGQAK